MEAFLAPPSTAWQRMATGNDPKEKGLLLQTPLSRYPPKPNTIPITSVLATRATRKTTRFSVRDAKYNAAGAMHRVAWALQDSKAIGQICEKPLENLWFCSGEDRIRTTYKFPGKIALRHHARREIRRAPISLFETTRNTIHRDQLATSLQPDLQGHKTGVPIAIHSAFQFVTTLRRGGWTQGNAEAEVVASVRRA